MAISSLNARGELDGQRMVVKLILPEETTFSDAIDILLKSYKREEIHGLHWFGPGKFQACMFNRNYLDKIVKQGVEINGRSFQAIPLTSTGTNVIIRNCPMDMARGLLCKYISNYGIITAYSEDVDRATGWVTGVRRLTIQMKQPLPNIIQIGVYGIMCHYEGVEIQCRRCLIKGHIVNQCNAKKCVYCKEFIHKLGCKVASFVETISEVAQRENEPSFNEAPETQEQAENIVNTAPKNTFYEQNFPSVGENLVNNENTINEEGFTLVENKKKKKKTRKSRSNSLVDTRNTEGIETHNSSYVRAIPPMGDETEIAAEKRNSESTVNGEGIQAQNSVYVRVIPPMGNKEDSTAEKSNDINADADSVTYTEQNCNTNSLEINLNANEIENVIDELFESSIIEEIEKQLDNFAVQKMGEIQSEEEDSFELHLRSDNEETRRSEVSFDKQVNQQSENMENENSDPMLEDLKAKYRKHANEELKSTTEKRSKKQKAKKQNKVQERELNLSESESSDAEQNQIVSLETKQNSNKKENKKSNTDNQEAKDREIAFDNEEQIRENTGINETQSENPVTEIIKSSAIAKGRYRKENIVAVNLYKDQTPTKARETAESKFFNHNVEITSFKIAEKPSWSPVKREFIRKDKITAEEVLAYESFESKIKGKALKSIQALKKFKENNVLSKEDYEALIKENVDFMTSICRELAEFDCLIELIEKIDLTIGYFNKNKSKLVWPRTTRSKSIPPNRD